MPSALPWCWQDWKVTALLAGEPEFDLRGFWSWPKCTCRPKFLIFIKKAVKANYVHILGDKQYHFSGLQHSPWPHNQLVFKVHCWLRLGSSPCFILISVCFNHKGSGEERKNIFHSFSWRHVIVKRRLKDQLDWRETWLFYMVECNRTRVELWVSFHYKAYKCYLKK